MKAESLKQMRPTDTELFHQFIDRLLDRTLDIRQLLDEDTLSELKKSFLYRGVAAEDDCRRFVETLDSGVAAKFCFPKQSDGQIHM